MMIKRKKNPRESQRTPGASRYHLHLLSDFLESGQRSVHVLLAEGRGNLCPKPRFPFRNNRKPEAFDVDSCLQERVAHVLCERGFTQHDRDNGVISFKDLEAKLYDLLPEIRRVLVESLDNGLVLHQKVECGGCTVDNGGRKRVRKDIRSGFLPEIRDEVLLPADVPSCRAADRFAECSGQYVDLAMYSL